MICGEGLTSFRRLGNLPNHLGARREGLTRERKLHILRREEEGDGGRASVRVWVEGEGGVWRSEE